MHRRSSSAKNFIVRPFEKLRKQMDHAESVIVVQQHPSKQPVPTDEELLSTAMSDVQEIKAFRALSLTQRQKKAMSCREKKDPDHAALSVLYEIAEGRRPINLPDTQEYVEWTNPAYHGDLTQQMHEGHFSIQAFLDLHGYNVAEAETMIEIFLKESFSRGLRCVKIIHGRGLRSAKGPQLKETVVKKLSGRYRKSIMAYVTARQCDGGLGALYILLKKK
ncbi:MAG TPA: Smr/MutS family protein [Nitrospirota bacterium]|nr:Smr/MutS family protein [Nitrospirota bacterium]